MTNDEIIAILKDELDVAQGYDADVLADKRGKALDYYFGQMQQAPKGRSNIVSHDVADTVHALMAQVGDIFRASQIEFQATNEDDEDQAQLESDFIKTILENNDEFSTFDSSVFDALLQGNGWISVDVLEETEVTRNRFEKLTPEEVLAAMMQVEPGNTELDVTNETNHADGTVSFDLKAEITTQTMEVRSVSPDVMLFSPSEDQYNLQQLRLVAERRLYTQSDLMDLGLTELEASEIPDFQDDYWPAIVAREARYYDNENELGGKQEATRLKETFICYILIDLDDTGQSERRKIHFGGSHIIENEPAGWIPYVTGSPIPMPHRIQGQGMYEIMRQVQDSKTGILRSYMDNLQVMNQSRVGYLKGEVDAADLMDGRINGAVGCDRPDAIWALPSNDIGIPAIQGLNYLDQVRTSRGGAALDLTTSQMQIAASSVAGATMEYSAKEKMAGYYCKNLAETLLKNTFLLVHLTLRELMPEKVNAKINGKWQESTPGDWPERQHALVNVGMTTTEKAAKSANLAQMMAKQEQWIQQGLEGIMTDKKKVYNTAADWIRSSEISANPDEYIIDPDSEEAQQAAQAQAEQAQQQQQAAEQAQQQQTAMLMQLEKMKDDTDRWKTEIETKFKYYDANLDADLKEAELTTDMTKDLMKAETIDDD